MVCMVPMQAIALEMAIATALRDGPDPSAMAAARVLLEPGMTGPDRLLVCRIMVSEGFPLAQAVAAIRLVGRELKAAATL